MSPTSFERPRAFAAQYGTEYGPNRVGSSISDVLARELSISQEEAANPERRLDLELNLRPPLYSTEYHSDNSEKTGTSEAGEKGGLVSKWRPKERLKTTAVALVVCLNIGVDPPDVVKVSPCARLEWWIDPLSMQPQKALEAPGSPK